MNSSMSSLMRSCEINEHYSNVVNEHYSNVVNEKKDVVKDNNKMEKH